MVVSPECGGFVEQCSGWSVVLWCWEKGHATFHAAAAVGPSHCPPDASVLVERAGPVLEGTEMPLFLLFWFTFVFWLVLFGKLSQTTAASSCWSL